MVSIGQLTFVILSIYFGKFFSIPQFVHLHPQPKVFFFYIHIPPFKKKLSKKHIRKIK